MFCRNCGKEIDDKAVVCVGCGVPPKKGKTFCGSCGKETNEAAEICISCGVKLAGSGGIGGAGGLDFSKITSSVQSGASGPKTKMVAGLLAILLGCWGLHKFYLGYSQQGIIMLVVSIVGIFLLGVPTLAMCVWAIYDGYRIFTGQIAEDAFGNALE